MSKYGGNSGGFLRLSACSLVAFYVVRSSLNPCDKLGYSSTEQGYAVTKHYCGEGPHLKANGYTDDD
jgi:hypothetical protein